MLVVISSCGGLADVKLATASPSEAQKSSEKTVPTVPFRVLDAPNLKDDYYCSVLAYSYTCHTLAVALTQKVYLWTEQYGVRYPPLPPVRAANFVTSLAFSSEKGGRAILAVARNCGTVTLWSLLEARPRFDTPHPSAASCVAFKPTETHRWSVADNQIVSCEDLLVGDDGGKIYYYSLEWPHPGPGSLTLLAKIEAHSQNICGLAWSPDGGQFVSGGNDNRALLFDPEVFLATAYRVPRSENDLDEGASPVTESRLRIEPVPDGVLTPPDSPDSDRQASRGEPFDFFTTWDSQTDSSGPDTPPASPERRGRSPNRSIVARSPPTWGRNRASVPVRPPIRNSLANPSVPGQVNVHLYSFYHSAAVKAMAFAPWQTNLLATGGGSNDRQIHFFHTESGATLALIDVFSQVTSLV